MANNGIPKSFLAAGFKPAEDRRRYRRLLIGTDGLSDSGKTEFIASCPGPGVVLCLDRGYDAMLENTNPPKERHSNFAYKDILIPHTSQSNDPDFYKKYWKDFYAQWRAALDLPEALTVGLDGDSDSWELQQLAEFGKVTQVPPLARTGVNAARRVMINRAYDANKIVVLTNKCKPEYKKVTVDGQEKEVDTGNVVPQGFRDRDYLVKIWLHHMVKPAHYNEKLGVEVPIQYGIRIDKCKKDPSLIGAELWGDDCNFRGLVSLVYPEVPISEWGL